MLTTNAQNMRRIATKAANLLDEMSDLEVLEFFNDHKSNGVFDGLPLVEDDMTISETLLCYPQATQYDRSWIPNVIGQQSVYSSYMSLHVDTQDLGKGGTYTIQVHRIHEDMQPNLVHWVDGRFVSTRLETGGTYTFRANRRHGLFPDDLAKLLVLTQSIKASNTLEKQLESNKKYPCIEFNFI